MNMERPLASMNACEQPLVLEQLCASVELKQPEPIPRHEKAPWLLRLESHNTFRDVVGERQLDEALFHVVVPADNATSSGNQPHEHWLEACTRQLPWRGEKREWAVGWWTTDNHRPQTPPPPGVVNDMRNRPPGRARAPMTTKNK